MGDEPDYKAGGSVSKGQTSKPGNWGSRQEGENRGKSSGKESAIRCCWNDRGEICSRPASLSTGTLGAGPWYCRDHYADLNHWPRWKVPSDLESMSEIDKRVNKVVPRLQGESEHDWSMRCKAYTLAAVREMVDKPHNKDWAHRILARQAKGEPMQMASIDLANDALKNQSMREPGEDEIETAVPPF